MDPIVGKILFFLGYVIPCIVIRGPHIDVRKKTRFCVDRKTRLDNGLFVAVSAASMGLPFLYVFTPLLGFADYAIPLGVQIAGVILLIAGNWIFWKSHRDLGRQWSPVLELCEDHKLVTKGIYRRIRHPMYTGIFLMLGGVAMVLQNYVAGLTGFTLFGILYLSRVRNEERMMIEQFGGDYRDYQKRTGRLLPKLSQSPRVEG